MIFLSLVKKGKCFVFVLTNGSNGYLEMADQSGGKLVSPSLVEQQSIRHDEPAAPFTIIYQGLSVFCLPFLKDGPTRIRKKLIFFPQFGI